ncbi:uncharacterized protein C14orf132 homolog isoform X1 [Lagopus muta]|uniref:uncharacterized protein C14orf132 homolog isoform X1 n=1 Tax=Lagopus muta TaxID=64668 RepID=UPI00209DC778|nr:uncharacterized protein C14orf132 homolog isoform X1 [Lagopus muta]
MWAGQPSPRRVGPHLGAGAACRAASCRVEPGATGAGTGPGAGPAAAPAAAGGGGARSAPLRPARPRQQRWQQPQHLWQLGQQLQRQQQHGPLLHGRAGFLLDAQKYFAWVNDFLEVITE